MKLVPVNYPLRPGAGVEFGYVVRRKGSQGNQVMFSFSAKVAVRMKWNSETFVRLDADIKERLAAFTTMNHGKNRLHRKIRIYPSGRGSVTVPYYDAVEQLLPEPEGMTALEIADYATDQLVFNLPQPPTTPTAKP